ncbi:Trk2p [Sugiyamaella lignohabitans]|uniref:Potassium transport protein n=1 Tax=Sugiyamaella lignohabitans TaxID=796027 RepID=A0A167ETS9_9ASCO|nr:Trk2p [Sugiyamaella lignohabitans]ANB14443.1 Trk2p [Sugiyamaella lignohabitans]
MTFLCSIILYPGGNIRYIDALFIGAAGCTQAGLNTVQLNELYTYQQIFLMIFPFLTTPIFIHSSVVFLRLHWFEKHFKDVKINSKIQSKLRRTATMARAESRDHEIGLEPLKWNGEYSKRDSNPPVPTSNNTEEVSGLHVPPASDIRFGDLPQPRRQKSIAPQDMYKSINMMQRNRRLSNDLNDGPALVIKSPRVMDEENELKEKMRLAATVTGQNVDSSPSSSGNASTEHESVDLGERIRPSISYAVSPERSNYDIDGIKLDRRSRTLSTSNVPNENQRSQHERTGSKASVTRGTRRFSRSRTLDRIFNRTLSNDGPTTKVMSTNYLSWQPTVGRNSAFVDLTEEQKEELGGVEYRSLKLLAKVLVAYYMGFYLFGLVTFWPYASLRNLLKDHFTSEGFTSTLWAWFTSVSAFSDTGFTLTPESMAFFQREAYIPLLSAFLIVIGNTGFPVLLRFIIWIAFKFTPRFGRAHESLGFLLDHPRRCFTLLFPSSATWWLLAVLVILNSVDLVLFLVLDLTSKAITEIPVGYRIVCGLFQAIATRTAGFTIVSMSDVHPAVRVSYVIMMYISVLPIAISVRRTNVYEEQSLGVYYPENDGEDPEAKHHSYVGAHLKKQLYFDLWFICLGLFIICIAEGAKLDNNEFQIFDVLFEIVSAYGTVGLSMGAANTNLALSGAFNVIGKLVIIALMIRGRHRGLPYALDRAIILQGDKIQRTDSIQETRTRNKRLMSMSIPINDDVGLTTARSNDTGYMRERPGLRTETSTLDRFPSQAVSDGEDD